jgi:hypothetical protein
MLKKYYFLWCISLITPVLCYSQGCSDAGFCTMGAMRPNQHYSKTIENKPHALDISQYLGITRFGDVILVYTADVNFTIKTKNQFQIKLPFQMVRGSLANTNGTSDLSLSYTRNIITSNNFQLNASIGTKIPTMEPNLKSSDGRPLPMYYQTSLGTYDLIAGISIITKKWLFATGYQQALNDVNNEFIWGAWKTSDKFDKASSYPVSKDLYRGSDIMARVERNFRSSKFNAYIGLLGIYRITKDKVYSVADKAVLPKDGTTGLALTALSGVGYRITTKFAIKTMIGVQLMQRDLNVDGLSRDFVQTFGVEYKF